MFKQPEMEETIQYKQHCDTWTSILICPQTQLCASTHTSTVIVWVQQSKVEKSQQRVSEQWFLIQLSSPASLTSAAPPSHACDLRELNTHSLIWSSNGNGVQFEYLNGRHFNFRVTLCSSVAAFHNVSHTHRRRGRQRGRKQRKSVEY